MRALTIFCPERVGKPSAKIRDSTLHLEDSHDCKNSLNSHCTIRTDQTLFIIEHRLDAPWGTQVSDIFNDRQEGNFNNNSYDEDVNSIEPVVQVRDSKRDKVGSSKVLRAYGARFKKKEHCQTTKSLDISFPSLSQSKSYGTQATATKSYCSKDKGKSWQAKVKSNKCCNSDSSVENDKTRKPCKIDSDMHSLRYRPQQNENQFDPRDENDKSKDFHDRSVLLQYPNSCIKNESGYTPPKTKPRPFLNTNNNTASIISEVSSANVDIEHRFRVDFGKLRDVSIKNWHRPSKSEKTAQSGRGTNETGDVYTYRANHSDVYDAEAFPKIVSAMHAGKDLSGKDASRCLLQGVASFSGPMVSNEPRKSADLSLFLQRPYTSQQDMSFRPSFSKKTVVGSSWGARKSFQKDARKPLQDGAGEVSKTVPVSDGLPETIEAASIKVKIVPGLSESNTLLMVETNRAFNLVPNLLPTPSKDHVLDNRDQLALQRRLSYTETTSHTCCLDPQAMMRFPHTQDSHIAFSQSRIPTLRRSPAYVCPQKCAPGSSSDTADCLQTADRDKFFYQSRASIVLGTRPGRPFGNPSLSSMSKSDKSLMGLSTPGASYANVRETVSFAKKPSLLWKLPSLKRSCYVRIDQNNLGTQRFYPWAPFNPAQVRRVHQNVIQRSQQPWLPHLHPTPAQRMLRTHRQNIAARALALEPKRSFGRTMTNLVKQKKS